MENYYDEVLTEIEGMIRDGNPGEAKLLLRRELSMPYIPQEVEERLIRLKKDAEYADSEKREVKECSTEILLDRLHMDARLQLSACAMLAGRNLRECIGPISEWLAGNPNPEAAALMIEALSEQEIDDSFEYTKDGIEYTFYPTDVVPVAKQKGFRKAERLLADWFLSYPDYAEMAHTLLVHEVYMFLPLSYDEDEGEMLALDTAEKVSEMMDGGEIIRKIRKRIASRS